MSEELAKHEYTRDFSENGLLVNLNCRKRYHLHKLIAHLTVLMLTTIVTFAAYGFFVKIFNEKSLAPVFCYRDC